MNIQNDIFGVNAINLRNKKLFLFDMDGTIYEEETVFDGTLDLLKIIEDIGGKYIFITNNSSKSVEDYVVKVNRLGIKANRDNFFTSVQATVLYLQKNFPNARVYCQGTKSFLRELSECRINVTEAVEDDVDLVLVGFDTELTSDKLRRTCELLQRDIPFIATNPDARCPVSFGFVPDCGSICNMLTAATNKKPIYIGKPEATMVEIVREKLNVCKDDVVVIGDRLYTDIATGLNAGVDSICVLTGEATQEDIIRGSIKPTYTFRNVRDIWKVMNN